MLRILSGPGGPPRYSRLPPPLRPPPPSLPPGAPNRRTSPLPPHRPQVPQRVWLLPAFRLLPLHLGQRRIGWRCTSNHQRPAAARAMITTIPMGTPPSTLTSYRRFKRNTWGPSAKGGILRYVMKFSRHQKRKSTQVRPARRRG